MRKKIKNYIKCPCCSEVKHKSELKLSLKLAKDFIKSDANYLHPQEYDFFNLLKETDIDWACDRCLDNNVAIVARPTQQTPSWSPHLVYYDTELECKECKSKFLFKKEEKVFWYEKLKFRLESIPKNCAKCRKRVRKRRLENRYLSRTLIDGVESINTQDLEKIIEIFNGWKNEEKSKFFSSILKKKTK